MATLLAVKSTDTASYKLERRKETKQKNVGVTDASRLNHVLLSPLVVFSVVSCIITFAYSSTHE